jgi:hypothetical protein
MDIDSFFDEVYEHLNSELGPSSVEVRRADETIIFWLDGEHAGLEVPKSDIENLFHYFSDTTLHEDQTKDRVKNKVKQDSCQYFVLKYL